MEPTSPAQTESLMPDSFILQAGQERIERQLEEQSYRLGRLEQVLSDLYQQISRQEEALVGQSLVLGRLADRLDRIERRLDLS